jgi:hypothetical protein
VLVVKEPLDTEHVPPVAPADPEALAPLLQVYVIPPYVIVTDEPPNAYAIRSPGETERIFVP